jgi:hypothetical protein
MPLAALPSFLPSFIHSFLYLVFEDDGTYRYHPRQRYGKLAKRQSNKNGRDQLFGMIRFPVSWFTTSISLSFACIKGTVLGHTSRRQRGTLPLARSSAPQNPEKTDVLLLL